MSADQELPERLSLDLQRARTLRYGENPHQKGALYIDQNDARPGVARARVVQGKELSYNNILDADAAFECAAEFTKPTAVIVKHTNPCGAATSSSLSEAYRRALACDPVSAFGGVVACNAEIDEVTAEEIVKTFLEVIIAPSASKKALDVLSKKSNLRVLLTEKMPEVNDENLQIRSIAGGILVHTRDSVVLKGEPRVVTKRAPTAQEMADMIFAFTIAKHAQSNAIIFARGGTTIGIGAGLPSRIDSVRHAARKMIELRSQSSGPLVVASDGFFPFRDSVDAAHEAGATAIIQPGGSQRDQESIDAANVFGIATVFTGVRHFRH